MESRLFAFRVARPIEVATEEPQECFYDPQTQTSVWGGSGKSVALYCTRAYGRRYCNAYSSYCNTWGSYTSSGRRCDS